MQAQEKLAASGVNVETLRGVSGGPGAEPLVRRPPKKENVRGAANGTGGGPKGGKPKGKGPSLSILGN